MFKAKMVVGLVCSIGLCLGTEAHAKSSLLDLLAGRIPAAKPSTKPVPKPSTKPVPKPVPKPQPKPSTKPMPPIVPPTGAMESVEVIFSQVRNIKSTIDCGYDLVNGALLKKCSESHSILGYQSLKHDTLPVYPDRPVSPYNPPMLELRFSDQKLAGGCLLKAKMAESNPKQYALRIIGSNETVSITQAASGVAGSRMQVASPQNEISAEAVAEGNSIDTNIPSPYPRVQQIYIDRLDQCSLGIRKN